MSLLTNISNVKLNKLLSKVDSRVVRYISISQAMEIGFVADISDESLYNQSIKLAQQFISEGKKVAIIYYFAGKDLPIYCTSEEFVIRKADTNFWGIPNNKAVNEFIEKSFDYLIDFSHSDSFVIKYIFSLSKAKLKVSSSDLETSKYSDIKFALNKEAKATEYIEAIYAYLTIKSIQE
jgi:hypothetical protein